MTVGEVLRKFKYDLLTEQEAEVLLRCIFVVALGRKGGQKGGKKRAENLTPAQRSKSARNAALRRWRLDKGKSYIPPAASGTEGKVM